MNLSYVSILFFTVSILCSCSTSKVLMTKGESIQLKEGFVQKVIPGTQDMEVKDYLTLNFKIYNTEEYNIDSIYYLNKVYFIQKQQLNYKLDLTKGVPAKNDKYTSTNENVSTVYYHKNNNPFYKTLDGIVRKEKLYMP